MKINIIWMRTAANPTDGNILCTRNGDVIVPEMRYDVNQISLIKVI